MDSLGCGTFPTRSKNANAQLAVISSWSKKRTNTTDTVPGRDKIISRSSPHVQYIEKRKTGLAGVDSTEFSLVEVFRQSPRDKGNYCLSIGGSFPNTPGPLVRFFLIRNSGFYQPAPKILILPPSDHWGVRSYCPRTVRTVVQYYFFLPRNPDLPS